MIPYTLIVTSAARPHLLYPTLGSLLSHVDQPPDRLLLHDDAAFEPGTAEADGRWQAVKAVLGTIRTPPPILVTHADPPRRMGLALAWLLANVETEYVLYSQDDFVTVRNLPIRRALMVMNDHSLHQIRFNKRATREYKDTWQGVWHKRERTFLMGAPTLQIPETLTVSDHWYFQTGLWRTSVIRAAVAWCTATPERTQIFAQGAAEEAINKVLDGAFGAIPGLTVPYIHDALDPDVRAAVQRTFIWGPIGEDRYIIHIGIDPKDFAGDHPRGPADASRWAAKQAQAWAEIASYAAQEQESRRKESRR